LAQTRYTLNADGIKKSSAPVSWPKNSPLIVLTFDHDPA